MLYPAFQKFYSAILNLERFKKENDFFCNISSLDSFFSELRNVTFVIQKSLAHTENLHKYEKLRDKYFNDDISRWLIKKRNQVLKEQPFELEKSIVVTVFSMKGVFKSKRVFTVENDEPYQSVLNSLKSFLLSFNELEVHFSVQFVYREVDKQENIFDYITKGITNMWSFLIELKNEVKDDSDLVTQLLEIIQTHSFLIAPIGIWHIDDYVYFSREKEFEKGKTTIISMPFWERMQINKLGDLLKMPACFFPADVDASMKPFWMFTIFHSIAYSYQKAIYPTFWIFYQDETMDFIMYNATIRTTTYRKIYEVSQRILNESDIKSVFFVQEAYTYQNIDKSKVDELIQTEYKYRPSKFEPSSSLILFYLDASGNDYYLTIDEKEVKSISNVLSALQHMDKGIASSMFYMIRDAFLEKRLN